MGHIKIDYENIFNTKQKTHVKWYFNPLSRAYHICYFDLLLFIYMKIWRGLMGG